MMSYAMRYIVLICCCMCAAVCAAAPNKGKQPSSAMYAQHVQKHPGDSETYCLWVEALLAEGDTAQAEQRIAYKLKFNEGDICMLRSKARIALARGNRTEAVRCVSDAVLSGWLPTTGDSLWLSVADCCGESLGLRLSLLSRREKTVSSIWRARAELALLQADTLQALAHYTTARQLGDTTLAEIIAGLQSAERTDSTHVKWSIPLTRTYDAYELQAKCNGLNIKVVVDTSAVLNTISGVESSFLLKNEYITQADIVGQTQVLIRELDVGSGIVLRNVLFNNRNTQDTPLILSLHAFDHLGEPKLNVKTNTIDIIGR